LIVSQSLSLSLLVYPSTASSSFPKSLYNSFLDDAEDADECMEDHLCPKDSEPLDLERQTGVRTDLQFAIEGDIGTCQLVTAYLKVSSSTLLTLFSSSSSYFYLSLFR
jgi:hypothetical protein